MLLEIMGFYFFDYNFIHYLRKSTLSMLNSKPYPYHVS
jgi:hypothetical protein